MVPDDYLFCGVDVSLIDAVGRGMCAGLLCNGRMSAALHLSCLVTYSNVYRFAAIELSQNFCQAESSRFPQGVVVYQACMPAFS